MFESLKKWNPFKFKRDKAEEKEKAVAASISSTPSTTLPMRDFLGYREMDKLFDQLWQTALTRGPFHSLDRGEEWFGNFSPAYFSPKIDVVDDTANLVVTAELPGLTGKEVEVLVQDGVLVIKGEKQVESKHEENGCFHTERAYGSFKRQLPLPLEVDHNKIEAQFENGLLTLKIPKVEGKNLREPVKVNIQ